jgi:hypothetical protein
MDNNGQIATKIQPSKAESEVASLSWVLVAHAYNPSYSGGRNQENYSSKLALGK